MKNGCHLICTIGRVVDFSNIGGNTEMEPKLRGYDNGKPVLEVDFVEDERSFVELVRSGDSRLVLVGYAGDVATCKFGNPLSAPNAVYCRPGEDEFTSHIRFPQSLCTYGSVDELLQRIESFLARCLDLDDRDRFLMACFVLSTWVVDRLPVAPYLALLGLPRSGKTTALTVLRLLCYRSLMTSDISSAAFYRACDRWRPTLFIDETATAGQKRMLFHLLRSGTTRDTIAFRGGHSYRPFGSKVVAWTEMPDDDALNSRCITIPMHETSRTDLLRPTEPDIVAAAGELQGKLLVFRFKKYNTLKLERIPGDERLRSRDRDLYEALALPISEDSKAGARLLECMEAHRDQNREPLSPRQTAVLESLFKQIHNQPDRDDYSLQNLKKEVNSNLVASGERFHLNEKDVSNLLRSFGFLNRNRTNSGYVVLIDRRARKRVHELLSLYGINAPSACLPSEASGESCEFCKPQESRAPDPPLVEQVASEVPVETVASTVSGPTSRECSERGERREHENSGDDDSFSTKFIGPGDQAIIDSLKLDPPLDWIEDEATSQPGFDD
jgi:ribosomal protein L34